MPRIEVAALDGSGRRLFITKNLIYPTGLAIDLPNQRLYWADPKTASIETVSLTGFDRKIVKTFGFGNLLVFDQVIGICFRQFLIYRSRQSYVFGYF